ncbi:hypothetical protein GWI33_005163 [Rhynchophorus ferrugineus]|uniref:Uncharacterized protein n=1 Tax=Rhynchophorus ferrugineus TaxID=354439 RepID=A0A834II20_RHYFE|nr:hypothetical protein GWI33_005163 [Rhynchophorus ferrugineus]
MLTRTRKGSFFSFHARRPPHDDQHNERLQIRLTHFLPGEKRHLRTVIKGILESICVDEVRTALMKLGQPYPHRMVGNKEGKTNCPTQQWQARPML